MKNCTILPFAALLEAFSFDGMNVQTYFLSLLFVTDEAKGSDCKSPECWSSSKQLSFVEFALQIVIDIIFRKLKRPLKW